MLDPWGEAAPVRATQPLSINYTSDADWLLPIVRVAWSTAYPGTFTDLDPWQAELIRRILETYPPGHPRAGQLRFRQVCVSLARQNGKSVIGAILGLYGLLRDMNSGLVIGLASSAEQARIIYDRTNQVITANPELAALFAKLTETRGIKSNGGAVYEIKAAKAAALQGLAISLGMVDELHLLKPALWNALVSGSGGRSNAVVVGITTAGDEGSELLIDLYKTGEKALAGDPDLERFGFFVWEAPESRIPTDRDELIRFLKAANPSLASGRDDIDAVISDIASQPPTEVLRYRFNRFVAGKAAFIDAGSWALCARPVGVPFPSASGVVFAIDRDPDWRFATITATVKVGLITHTEIVASIKKPTLGQLVNVCVGLYAHSPSTYVMDRYSLGALGEELKKRGMTTTILNQSDVVNASSMAYSKIMQRKISHGADPLLAQQIPRTVRKNVGESYRISKADSSVEIDAVMATVFGIYVVETRPETPVQIF